MLATANHDALAQALVADHLVAGRDVSMAAAACAQRGQRLAQTLSRLGLVADTDIAAVFARQSGLALAKRADLASRTER